MRRCGLWRGQGATLVFLAFLGACATGPRPETERALVASSDSYEPDIPLPCGFRLVDHSSEDWTGGSIRYLRHRYVGRADLHATRRFYREQMPLVRWKLLTDGSVDGRREMRFERNAESCTVVLKQSTALLLRRLTIEVTITPAAR